MISKIKRIIHCFLLNIIDLVAIRKANIKEKSLAIIRVDAIGDYILFRDFLPLLKVSNQYKDYKITLIGNGVWKALAEALDSEYVDDFIFLDRNKFYRKYSYRFMMLRKLSSFGFDIVLNPMYSREYYISESITKSLSAHEKITCEGDHSNISAHDKKKADSFYTRLFLNTKEVMFEFYRNQQFFEQLLGKPLSIHMSIDKRKLPVFNQMLPSHFIVLFLGASRPYRKWSAKNFAEVAIFLKQKYHYEIVICGAPSDIEQAQLFKKFFKYDYVDLVGKTTLLELMSVILQSQFLISNETSAVHFAVALGVSKVIVLYNGRHFGRFTPYPESLHQGYKVVCHPEIAKNKNVYQEISHDRMYINQLDINDITVDEVSRVIESS
ncbi:hypothetical protein DKL61_02875 [Gammaproteobacteria bacterium ESL0073]|nr:hypothetical protein DKL61_02875 [Gammaproteobacteria bacterium ESL0073]